MKTTTKSRIGATFLMALLSLGGLAANAQASAQNSHMMGQMDSDHMMGMMHECMEMHKDGKMCEHQTMEQCQQKMGKTECQNMMKDIEKKEKSEKKSKGKK